MDCEAAAKPEAGVAGPLQARLKFGGAKLLDTIKGVRDLKQLPDPINEVQIHREIAAGLTMKRVTVPLGVLGIIFEARPDASIQIASLGIKSGNGVLLKCGREAIKSCTAIVGQSSDPARAWRPLLAGEVLWLMRECPVRGHQGRAFRIEGVA